MANPSLAQFVIGPFAMQVDDIMNPSSPKPSATLVGDLFINHDDVVEEAFALMSENHVTALPVLGPGGEVVGSVSYVELLRRLPGARQRALGQTPRAPKGPRGSVLIPAEEPKAE